MSGSNSGCFVRQFTSNGMPDAGDFRKRRLAFDIMDLVAACESLGLPSLVDLRHATHLRPYSIACLAAVGALGEQAIPAVLPADEDCRQHLVRLGLFKWFKADAPEVDQRDTNVPIRQLTTDALGTFSSDAMKIWEAAVGGLTAGYRPRLEDHLDEIIGNAIYHAESPIGCMVAGQAFPKRQAVEVAVVDLGQSIRGHLSKHPQYTSIASDHDAIFTAVKEAVTGVVGFGKYNEPHSGAGLHELRAFCGSGYGEMAIISGNALCVFGPNGTRTTSHTMRRRFPGTLVNVHFDTNPGLPFEPIDDIIF